MSTSASVYVGIWIDWSKGVVSGSTLTLSVRDGAVLISVLSLFIQIIGGQSWSILCFIAHQLRTTRDAKDGLFYQQQAMLRNNTSDASTSWNLTKIGWSWRAQTSKGIQKSIWLVLLGLTHLLLFGAAGVLSSHIVTIGNEVLLATSPSCGLWTAYSVANESQFVEAVDFTLNQQNTLALSNQYVQNCLNGSQASPVCKTFKTSQLNWTFVTDAPCPFEDGMCLGPPNSSLLIDTGLIDSRNDLGINGDDSHRVQYRKTATCIPLVTDGYWEHGNTTFNNMTYTWNAAFYGLNNGYVSALPQNGNVPNATYVHSNFQDIRLLYDMVSGSSYYNVNAQLAYPTSPEIGFTPIDALSGQNRSLTLVFASFMGSYTGPSDDLWLSVHRTANATTLLAGNETLVVPEYFIDQDVSVLACTEQHQFCNPNPASNNINKCTPFLSIDEFVNSDGLLGGGPLTSVMDNSYQSSIAAIIQLAAYESGFDSVISQVNPPLLAAGLAANGASPPLPDNQWILEATNWFSIGMVNTQRIVVNTATGPPGKDAQYTALQADHNFAMHWYCASQIVQREDFISFSVLAISLIFAGGGLLVVISMGLETVISWWQLRYRKGLYQQVRWQLDSTLQLQRMAFEEVGLGTWKGGANDVPVTEKGEMFAPAEEWDEWHPSIKGKAIGKRERSVVSGWIQRDHVGDFF